MGQIYYATGRRKEAVARVYLQEGNGKITVNDQPLEEYIPTLYRQKMLVSPLEFLGVRNKYDIKIFVKGGGETGQAEAAKHGIARALAQISEDFRDKLREEGFLTRDPRTVERKHYGRAKARRGFQSSKR